MSLFEKPIGFGTAGFESSTVARKSVRRALTAGYRHFDTARQYSHTNAVGTAIENSAVSLDDLTIASKIHSDNLDYESLLTEADAAANELGLEVLDILYVHWPAHSYSPEQTFAGMTELLERERIRNVGVCNFTEDLLREAQSVSSAPISVNQVEMHPFLQQDELLHYCQAEGIEIVAHTPLAGGKVFESPVLQEIASAYDATVPQIVLAWLTSHENVSAIPKATNEHIEGNYRALELTLDCADIKKIDSIETEHRVVDYRFAPWNQ